MLRSLRIKNFAIIDDILIEFDNGFNVFTGETGAGKSIIVTALSYLFKGRSDSSLVRNGFDKAIIEGVFEIKDDYIKEKLKEQDIEYDGSLIVKRVIDKDNHNFIKLNESSITLNFLTNLLSNYVDIHSQRDSQFLFEKKNQVLLFDRYCDINDKLIEYKKLFKRYQTKLNEYNQLLNNEYSDADYEFFKYNLDELEKADLKPNELEELEELEKKLKSKEKYQKLLEEAIAIYNSDAGLKENFYRLINTLNINDNNIISIKDSLNDLYYSLDEEINKLTRYYKSLDGDEYDLEKIEERLYIYSKLCRKHKTDVNGLLVLLNDFRTKLNAFKDRDSLLNEKEKEVKKAYEEAYQLALDISKIRKAKAILLSKDIKRETNDLLLENCLFTVTITNKDLNINGIDDIEFKVQMNKGDKLKELKNVASGGEMSRLLLALKSIFIKLSNIDLLILDEIDTGVSGKAGMLIGRKIAEIAKNCQVLCISHLALVAAFASSHYYIYKEDINNKTCTKIKKLNKDEIIKELASISSSVIDDNSLAAAKDLYDNAQKKVMEKDEKNICSSY